MVDEPDDSEDDKRDLEKSTVAQTPDKDPRDTDDGTQAEDG